MAQIPGDDKARELEARFSMLETLADHDDQLMEQLLEEIEPPKDAIFDDLAADYFRRQLLPASFHALPPAPYRQALKIFQSGHHHPLKDKVALVLLSDNERQRFLFYLADYIQGRTSIEQLDVYLLHKFGMDHYSFPYMSTLSTIMHTPEKLPALLEMAAMEA